ncbi:MAG: hypothetical protein QM523_01335 [Candidatus Pacebacteria bacterium]|nr:hypothetical protein [Candidatus Paceibacterota bacterium]
MGTIGLVRVMMMALAFWAGLSHYLCQIDLAVAAESAESVAAVQAQTNQPPAVKKKPGKKNPSRLVTIPPGEIDPTEPRPLAAPIDPVVSLRLLEAEIKSSDDKKLPDLQPPPQFVTVTSPVMPSSRDAKSADHLPPSEPDRTLAVVAGESSPSPASTKDGVKKFVPPIEIVSLWVNLRSTAALGDMSRAMVLQKWQELTADRAVSKKHQRGFVTLLNATAVLVDGRDHRLALETIRQRSRVWQAVQNGFDPMGLPLDESLIVAATEQQNPNYRPPTRYDDLRGVLLLQGLTCPLVTRFIKLTEGDWLVSCNNRHRYRVNQMPSGEILAAAYEWRE